MSNITVGIVGNGETKMLPTLKEYKNKVDVWIGADRGAYFVIKEGLPLEYALGDFDSVSESELNAIQSQATHFDIFPKEKDETDLELALHQAFSLKPETILLFGVTGSRKDHELINIQLLYSISKQGMKGVILDSGNYIELTLPGTHHVTNDPAYPMISFVPFTEEVKGLTLKGFYYLLENEILRWGSTLCISNKLSAKSGTFSFESGILLLIKSRD